MGRLVAATKELSPSVLYDRYQGLLMEALSAKPTVKKSAGVLLHMMGHVEKVLTGRREAGTPRGDHPVPGEADPAHCPGDARRPLRPKIPRFLLDRQVFLNPHPVELMLRNHV